MTIHTPLEQTEKRSTTRAFSPAVEWPNADRYPQCRTFDPATFRKNPDDKHRDTNQESQWQMADL